ncbi:MAG: hydrogenase maturation protease [Spirochaetia bacterium]
MKILVRGYGNPGRQDDGLGVLFVERLEAWAALAGVSSVSFDADYQLHAEAAYDLAQLDLTLFVDAAADQQQPFRLARVLPGKALSFSTHGMSPEEVVALASELYGAAPQVFLLTIRGYGWEPFEELTPGAAANLDAALDFAKPLLLNPADKAGLYFTQG